MAGTFVQYTPASSSSLQLAPSGSASAPSYSFSAQSNLGFYRSASNEVSLSIGGSQYFKWGDSGFGGGLMTIPSEVGSILIGGTAADPGNTGNTLVVASSLYNASLVAKVASATAASTPIIKCLRLRGTLAVPTAVSAGDQMGLHSFQAYNGTNFVEAAGMLAVARGAWNATGATSDLVYRLANTVSGVTTFTDCMRLLNTVFDVQIDAGNLIINTLGKGIQIRTGNNARVGVSTLVAGTVTVSNTSVTANTLVMVNHATAGGTLGILSSTKSNGVSFTITSTLGTDTSTVNWMLVEALP